MFESISVHSKIEDQRKDSKNLSIFINSLRFFLYSVRRVHRHNVSFISPIDVEKIKIESKSPNIEKKIGSTSV